MSIINAPRSPLLELTEQMEAEPSFSYVRMGDGELDFLLKVQARNESGIHRHPDRPSVEVAHCCPGIRPETAERLLQSYEIASYVDLHSHLDFNREHLPLLRWQPRVGQRQGGSGLSPAGILQAWTIQELPGYLRRHRCLFFGPEAGLLRELLEDENYRLLSNRFWADAASCHFLDPTGGGLDLSHYLEHFKRQIAQAIETTGCDTVFVSLGGAAKIVCVEVARELGVRAIDFGSMMRMLTYSGSAGHASWRASYLPFLFRIPLPVYMAAYRRAFPRATADKILLKAQCQVCLELQDLTPGISTPSDVISVDTLDRSADASHRFHAAYRFYRRLRNRLAWRTFSGLRITWSFEWWIMKKQVEAKGRLCGRLRSWRRRWRASGPVTARR